VIEIYQNIFVGDEQDFYRVNFDFANCMEEEWHILHCCKDPFHRAFVGYVGRGAPKESPEYLFARRGNRMALNMVDAKSPEFFSKEMITAGLDFLEEGYKAGKKILIHCNRGESRSPSVAMLFVFRRILKATSNDGERTAYAFTTFEEAEAEMKQIYPAYAPADGIRGHLMQYWNEY
jgi:hypothetical protein